MRDDVILAVVGLVAFAAFVGGLAVAIDAPPLRIIIAAVVVMVAYDFVRELRG